MDKKTVETKEVTRMIRNAQDAVKPVLNRMDERLTKSTEQYLEIEKTLDSFKIPDSLPPETKMLLEQQNTLAKFCTRGFAMVSIELSLVESIFVTFNALFSLLMHMQESAPTKEDVKTLKFQLGRYEPVIKSLNDLIKKREKEQEAFEKQLKQAEKIYG